MWFSANILSIVNGWSFYIGLPNYLIKCHIESQMWRLPLSSPLLDNQVVIVPIILDVVIQAKKQ